MRNGSVKQKVLDDFSAELTNSKKKDEINYFLPLKTK
jgi:hypothetical protein